jgi:sialidase-1
MKRLYLSVFVLLIPTAIVIAQTAPVTVFESGAGGHKSYRIPAIVTVKNGTLLAFAEGRVNNAGDFGDINIVLKRSMDNGKTWSAIQTVVNYDQLQAGNPAPVVDLTDPLYPQGRVFLFYNTGNNHESEVRKGKGLREVWYKTSTDAGATWSEAVNITKQTHKPRQPTANAEYNFKEDWRSYANTPGHAMQFNTGIYKGRIFVAANHSAGEPLKQAEDYKAHGFYTDDHGKTFQLSETVERPGGNEAMATEISSNRLMMNVRNQKGDVRARLIAISKDGGAKWDSVYFDHNLPDPVCQGSILTVSKKKGKSIVAFCNAADTKNRDNLTLRISYDDGFIWKKSFAIDSTGKRDNAAYSDIVRISKKKIGVLYEKENYAKIIFTVVKWN